MAKKKNSRKALAVALGIMGVAGLSVASASQLTINTDDENVAVGSVNIAAACDDEVTVDFNFDLATGQYTTVSITDIETGCAGKSLTWTLNTSEATDPTGTVASLSATSVTASIAAIPLTADLNSIDIAIY